MAGVIPLPLKQWLSALFFVRNYNLFSQVPGKIDWYTGHFWSLAVEEHFYLLLPGLLVFVPKRWRVVSLVSVAAAVEIWRAYRQQTHGWFALVHHTDTRLDALLIPALCAVLMSDPRWRSRLTKLVRFWPLMAAVAVYSATTDHFQTVTKLASNFLGPRLSARYGSQSWRHRRPVSRTPSPAMDGPVIL